MSSIASDLIAATSYANTSRQQTMCIFSCVTFAYIFVPVSQCRSREQKLAQYMKNDQPCRIIGVLADMGSENPMFRLRDILEHQKGAPLLQRDFIVKGKYLTAIR